LDVMKGETEVPLATPLGARSASSERRRGRRPAADARPLSVEERQLFDQLRDLRRRIADERDIPPYVVFSDATLRDLIRVRPATLEQMLEVKGVGQRKLESFGSEFLEALAAAPVD
ncbi:MAG: HRDC domain-containing protein, partial [Planctomycetota bacterium]|nr:HRDC domain-containing protein [Planctomycetota bacterium]